MYGTNRMASWLQTSRWTLLNLVSLTILCSNRVGIFTYKCKESNMHWSLEIAVC